MLRFMSGDIFVEIEGNCIYMWDIVRNVWMCWKHGLETVQAVSMNINIVTLTDKMTYFTQAFIDYKRVILIGFNWIRGWKFPDNRSWILFDKVSPIDIAPDFVLPIIQPSSPSYHLARNHSSVYRSASAWYSGQSVAPFLFDIIESGSSSEYFTVSYDIHAPSVDHDGSETNEWIEEWATALIQDFNYGDLPIGWDSWRLLDRQIFKCFSNFDTIQLAVSGDNVTKAADRIYSYYDPVVSLENTGDNLLQFGEFSFDPISGRLCYASLLDEGSIVVLNFLPGGWALTTFNAMETRGIQKIKRAVEWINSK